MTPLAAMLAPLTPAQREALARRQSDPRVAAMVRGEAPPDPRPSPAGGRVEVSARAEGDGSVFVVAKGLRLVNTSNAREHWNARARRARRERELFAAALASCAPPAGCAWRVTITREGRGTMDDDGLAAAGKAVRDAVAAWLRVDDSPAAPVVWSYQQRRARGYSVFVRVEGVSARIALEFQRELWARRENEVEETPSPKAFQHGAPGERRHWARRENEVEEMPSAKAFQHGAPGERRDY